MDRETLQSNLEWRQESYKSSESANFPFDASKISNRKWDKLSRHFQVSL